MNNYRVKHSVVYLVYLKKDKKMKDKKGNYWSFQ